MSTDPEWLHTHPLPAPVFHPLSLTESYERLLAATSTQYHQFIADDISLLDGALVRYRDLSSYRQLTDVYLLALAVAHDARLVTLDTHIPLSAVRDANESHLAEIQPSRRPSPRSQVVRRALGPRRQTTAPRVQLSVGARGL